MKKLLFTLALATAFALTSCKKEVELIIPEVTIGVSGSDDNIDGGISIPQDGTITLTATASNTEIFTVQWSVGGKVLSTEKTFTYTATELGEHTIFVDVLNNDGGKAKAEVKVVVHGKYKYGTFVVNEGSVFAENSFITFISPTGVVTDSVYHKVNGSSIGNATQDMFIANNKAYFISQNGNKLGADGTLVIANAETLKKEAAFNEEVKTLSWPTHVAVIGKNIYIRDNKGVHLFNLDTKTIKLIAGTKGAAKNRMAVIGEKIFAAAGKNVFVIKGETVDTIKFTGTVSGIIKSKDNKLWISCTTTPGQINKVDPSNNTIIQTNEVGDAKIGAGYGATPAISAKGDTIYFSNSTTRIYRHIFSTKQTAFMVDVKEHVENAGMVYNNLAVHPKTGHVYFLTIKGYGNDFLINNISVFNLNATPATKVADYKNHTHFPAGIFFTDNF